MNRLLTVGERRHRNVGKTARRKAKRKRLRLTTLELQYALERRAQKRRRLEGKV